MLHSFDTTNNGWPSRIQQELAGAAKAETAFQLLRDNYIRRFLTECQVRQVEPVFFKGYALGQTVYPNPCTRPSVDVDLIVKPGDIDTIVGILESQGFQLFAPYRGKLHSNEVVCRRTVNGVSLEFDCHFAINNRPLLAKLLNYDELKARAVPIEMKTANSGERIDSLVPCLEHSLFLACIHKVAHNNTEDLLWLSDFSHIANAMDQSQIEAFLRLCQDKMASRICAAGIRSAGSSLRHRDLCAIAKQLDSDSKPNEPTAVYLRDNRSSGGDAFVRWNSLETLRKKAYYLAELLFPKRSFLVWKYGANSPFPYLRNIKDLVEMIAKAIFAQVRRVKEPGATNRQGPN